MTFLPLRPLLFAATVLVVTTTGAPAQTNPADERAFRRGHQDYVAGDFAGALDEWRTLALTGHVPSMNNVAIMYAQGLGTAPDAEMAFMWYRRASDAGHARAMLNLGISYERGRGVEPDDWQAAQWYLRAARHDLPEGMNALAWLLATSPDPELRNGEEAVAWARVAVQDEATAERFDTLAAAHAEAGDFDQAVTAIERAIDLMESETATAAHGNEEDAPAPALNGQDRDRKLALLRERLASFRNGRAIRD